ncbi:MAG: amidohydrolase family protein [Desulfovibrio sp.]|nr:amidohydrolase family protein [Desulfovibrio sp.]
MIPPDDTEYVIHAKKFASMAREFPKRGLAVAEPLRVVDNAFITVKNGRVEKISSRRPPWRLKFIEIDSGYLTPPLVNAHTHLQLSWLKNRLELGRGFATWLKSLVPILLKTKNFEASRAREAARKAVEELLAGGALFVGDIGGSIPGALTFISRETNNRSMIARLFCERFGWEKCDDVWPSRCRDEIKDLINAAPCGHALYSTSPAALMETRRWCRAHGLPFSIHLAESIEEDLLLLDGAGELCEYYRDKVLPSDWTPPGKKPAEYAASLGLLGAGSLAVHGVRLSGRDLKLLATSGCALCLCPRSNASINVGLAPFKEALESDVLLCLGTDSLASCPDLDARRDAVYLREKFDFPPAALIRMLTVNGAAALGFDYRRCQIREGYKASFARVENLD